AYIPGGSGNDFRRGLSMTMNATETFIRIFDEKYARQYKVATYETKLEKQGYFLNCLGFGFDAVVAQAVHKSRFKKIANKLKLGPLVYAITVFKKIWSYKPIDVTVTVDKVKKEYSTCFLITINNQPYFGGGMKINPLAHYESSELS